MSVFGCQPSAVSHQLSAIRHRLSVVRLEERGVSRGYRAFGVCLTPAKRPGHCGGLRFNSGLFMVAHGSGANRWCVGGCLRPVFTPWSMPVTHMG